MRVYSRPMWGSHRGHGYATDKTISGLPTLGLGFLDLHEGHKERANHMAKLGLHEFVALAAPRVRMSAGSEGLVGLHAFVG